MTNNTIPNVPCELLEELRDAANESMNATTRQHQIDHFAWLIAKADALLSAPSPAGVDGCKCSMSISMLGDGCRHCQPQEYIDRLGEMLDEERSELSDAQAIIDGLRGEVGAQRVKTCTALKERNDARAERDQHAKRIGELEGLLRSCLPALSDGGCAALANRIDAALSAGKEGSDGIP